jgi:UPF0176 protein
MVLNIAAYHFTPVAEVDALIACLRERAQALTLRGTVLVAPEGVNVFLAGPEAAVDAWLAALRAEPGFEALSVKRSWSEHVPFARLKIKRKREIIAFRDEQASPLRQRAPGVDAPTLARWIAQGHDDDGRRLVLLDTRNREEFGYGSFAGALTLPIDNFTDLPAALEPQREALADATVVGFCTGGIRCEKAVNWMRGHGLPHALQLEDGILGYFEQVGGFGYEGQCFVFDQRVALDAQLRPLVDAPACAGK